MQGADYHAQRFANYTRIQTVLAQKTVFTPIMYLNDQAPPTTTPEQCEQEWRRLFSTPPYTSRWRKPIELGAGGYGKVYQVELRPELVSTNTTTLPSLAIKHTNKSELIEADRTLLVSQLVLQSHSPHFLMGYGYWHCRSFVPFDPAQHIDVFEAMDHIRKLPENERMVMLEKLEPHLYVHDKDYRRLKHLWQTKRSMFLHLHDHVEILDTHVEDKDWKLLSRLGKLATYILDDIRDQHVNAHELIIMEKADGTLRQYLRRPQLTCTDVYWMSVQIMMACAALLKYTGLSQSDLLFGNIMYQKTPPDMVHVYEFTPAFRVRIPIQGIMFVLIDMGLSTTKQGFDDRDANPPTHWCVGGIPRTDAEAESWKDYECSFWTRDLLEFFHNLTQTAHRPKCLDQDDWFDQSYEYVRNTYREVKTWGHLVQTIQFLIQSHPLHAATLLHNPSPSDVVFTFEE